MSGQGVQRAVGDFLSDRGDSVTVGHNAPALGELSSASDWSMEDGRAPRAGESGRRETGDVGQGGESGQTRGGPRLVVSTRHEVSSALGAQNDAGTQFFVL